MGCVATRNFEAQKNNGEVGVRVSFTKPADAALKSQIGGSFIQSSSSIRSVSTPREQPPSPTTAYPGDLEVFWTPKYKEEDLAYLVSLGFDSNLAVQMLETSNGDVGFAEAMLRETKTVKTPTSERMRFSFQQVQNQLTPTTESGTGSKTEDSAKLAPRADEIDYTLHFEPPKFGFEIKSGFHGHNAIVSRTLEQHAIDSLMPSSLIVSINNQSVLGWTLDKIRDEMNRAMETGKVVKMKFRAKKNLLEKFWVHGTLVIMVLGGQVLREYATHACVRVNHVTLCTEKLDHESKDPVWNSTITYRNVYPARIGQGCLSVYKTNPVIGPSEFGTAWFTLPTEVDRIKDKILELRDSRGNVSGLVPIKMMLKSKRY